MATVNVDALATAIVSELQTYVDNTVEDVEHAVKLVAKATAEELQRTSPVETGEYAENWSCRRSPNNGTGFNGMTVYSKSPQHAKTHVLEKGHRAVDGGFVAPRPHIKAAEEKAYQMLDEQLNKVSRR